MIRFIILRFVRWIPGVFMLLLVVYGLMFFGGGDPVRIMYSEAGIMSFDPSDPVYQAIRHEMGFDRPFLVQFGEYLWNTVRGDLGISLQYKRPVNDMIIGALPVTIEIAFSALVLIAILGVTLGVVAAFNQNSWIDSVILGGALFFWGIPTHVLGPLMMVIFCLWWPILGVPHGWDGPFALTAILPLTVAALRPMAIVIRQARSAVIEVLSEDYIRTAHAKGLPVRVVVIKHALRPVLSPVVTQLGMTLSNLLSGSLLLETVFGIPGIGRLIKNGIINNDFPVLLASTLVILSMVTLVNLLVDTLYPLLDPRLRLA